MKGKLYRSKTDSKICGVCGGLGTYFGIDATIVRLLFVFSCFWGGAGLVMYVAGAILIPLESDYIDGEYTEKEI